MTLLRRQYRIVSNGQEFRIQHGVKFLWFTWWLILGNVAYKTREKAEEMIRYLEESADDKFKLVK